MYSDEQLWKFLDGEASDAEARAIAESAAADPALERRLEQLRAVKREVLAGAPEPPPDFPERVAAQATRRTRDSILDLEEARRFLKGALVAAAVLAAVGIAFLAFEVLPGWLE
ncbi:MAG: anti-sigma factor, partial [Planctomycetota bacterium]